MRDTLTVNQPLLETRNLSIGYRSGSGGSLFEGMNLRLEKGAFTCLMGPNGAGKSTLLRTLTGLQEPLAGDIRYMGDDTLMNDAKRRARTFSVVLTDRLPVGLLSVRETVAIGRHPYTGWMGAFSSTDRQRVDWAVSAVHLEKLAERKVHTLSDGERQRVMVARALAQDTPIIFLDEPSAFLDLPHKIELMHILRNLSVECGLTLLMSTHDLDLALQFADSLWLLGVKKRYGFGAPEDLLLKGEIETYFSGNHQGLRFDREQAVFQSVRHFRAHVALSGDALACKWTQNALEKMGIGVDPESQQYAVHVEKGKDQQYQWTYQTPLGEGNCDSVSGLLQFLSGKG